MTSSSKLNFLIDYCKFDKNRNIRNEIYKIISSDQKTFDYGNGYFYQSCEKIGITGLRQTKKRADTLNLKDFTKGKRVLDIGTNTGFLLFQIDNNFDSCDGIDWNPVLINVANKVKNYLKINNIYFYCENFLNFNFNQNYDVILSLANHTTFDGGIKDYEEYFNKIFKILKINGLLVLESHHISIESPDKFKQIIKYLLPNYNIIKELNYKFFNYADDNRQILFLKKKL